MRTGSSRLPVLLIGVVVLATGGALAFRALDSGEDQPQDNGQVITPEVKVETPQTEVATASLVEPGTPEDNRPRGTLYGNVIDDKTEAAIEAFALRAIPSPKPTDPTVWDDCWVQNISGPQGEWGVPFYEPGMYTLRFEATGYAHAYFENIEIPSPLEYLTVRMNHGRWLHGQIVTAEGKPAPDFAIRLAPQYSLGGTNEAGALETETDQYGMYGFSSVPEGRWKVELAGLEGVLREPPTSEEFTLAEGGEIVWDQTLPALTKVRMNVKYKAKRWILVKVNAKLTNSWGANIVTSIENGVAEFQFVEPGTYTLSIGKPDEDPWYTDIVDVEESATPLNWERVVSPPARELPEFDIPRAGKKGGKRNR